MNSRERICDDVYGHRRTLAIKRESAALPEWAERFRELAEASMDVQIVSNLSESFIFSSIESVLYFVDGSGMTEDQCNELSEFLMTGGRCAVLLSGDMPRDLLSNINYFIEQFGICGNPDCVVDCLYKERLVPEHASALLGANLLPFVYPSGCTLTVQDPAIILAVSSRNSYPVSQPVCACTITPPSGRLLVIGSCEILSTEINRKNDFIDTVLVPFLVDGRWQTPDPIPADTLPPYKLIPDLVYMAGMVDDLKEPGDVVNKFKPRWSTIDEDIRAEVLQAYELLGVPLGPLTMDFTDPVYFLLPDISFSPIVVEDTSQYSEKVPLVDLHYIAKGAPPLKARSDEEIEYALDSNNPKLKLFDIASKLVSNSSSL